MCGTRGRALAPCGIQTHGTFARLGAVEVHVVREALDLVDRQALVEGQQHLHLVAALQARPRQARHHIAQTAHLRAATSHGGIALGCSFDGLRLEYLRKIMVGSRAAVVQRQLAFAMGAISAVRWTTCSG